MVCTLLLPSSSSRFRLCFVSFSMFISTLQHYTSACCCCSASPFLLLHTFGTNFHVIFYICFLRSWLDFVFSSCFALHCCILRDNSLFTRVYCS
uniref:Putative secreted protein n=1 Tax=Anopheles marajoara TaxID=58244 RepID=A0A2M4C9I7_9DIPT